MALDAEGLDYKILKSWDEVKYPFKIIISEIMDDEEEPIETILYERGYKIYARTIENIVWVRNEYQILV